MQAFLYKVAYDHILKGGHRAQVCKQIMQQVQSVQSCISVLCLPRRIEGHLGLGFCCFFGDRIDAVPDQDGVDFYQD